MAVASAPLRDISHVGIDLSNGLVDVRGRHQLLTACRITGDAASRHSMNPDEGAEMIFIVVVVAQPGQSRRVRPTPNPQQQPPFRANQHVPSDGRVR